MASDGIGIDDGITPRKVRRATALAMMALMLLPLPSWLSPGDSVAAQSGREILFLILGILILCYVRFVEQRPLASIGLRRPTARTLGWGLIAGAALVAAFAAIYLLVFPLIGVPPETQLAALQQTPFPLRVVIVLRAAMFEEILFRGFAIERLSEILASRRLAALLSFIVFTLMHLPYWGAAHLLIAGVGGAGLTLLYLWRRDLGCTMIAHFIADAAGLLV